jgi:hypothetical protein
MHLRDRSLFSRETAMLFMGSASCHVSEKTLKLSSENRVVAVAFLDHTINTFQALEIVLFKSLEKLRVSTTGKLDDKSINDQVTKTTSGP